MTLIDTRTLTLEVAGRILCRDLSVAFSEGENWAVLGANGSGKTTLLHTLAGLRPAAAGEVRLHGRDIAGYPARERARRLGVVFQDTTTAFPATVLDTVLSGRHPYLSRWEWESAGDVDMAQAALSAVGLNGFARRHLSTLSGGERRRVEIAALLAQNPPIRLLDEPTNHLDLRYQVQILDLLTGRMREAGRLNVFVLHDLNLAIRFCSHGLLLFGDGGSEHGALDEILNIASLERLYGCPMREVSAGDSRLYLPA